MSRIDEALKRTSHARTMTGQQAESLFVSPWNDAPDDGRSARTAEPPVSQIEISSYLPVVRPPAGERVQFVSERFQAGWRERLTTWRDADPGLIEEFRRLAAVLLQKKRVDGLKACLVTSAAPDDGKTLTALNLALILSESYRHKVLLVDADLRRSTISEAAGYSGVEGLNEALTSSEGRKAAVIALSETLTLLPAGVPVPDPLSALTSLRMQRMLSDAAAQFDWVIVDAPPVGATADAGLLCHMVDGVIVVVRAGRTRHPAVLNTIDVLGRDRILGVVLNGVDGSTAAGLGYYGSYAPRRSE
jgi:protein-tyrosine kinase